VTVPLGGQSTRALMTESEIELWTAFRRGDQFAQMGDRGDVREERLTKFLVEQLPGRYSVTSGEIIDAAGNRSGQTDIIIYDGANTRPLVSSGNVAIVPAEAVLATIEVKSKLTKPEVEKVVKGVQKLRVLRPWDAPWAVARQGGQPADDRMPRIFTTLFAYRSDLVPGNWAGTELERFRNCAQDGRTAIQYLDRLVVLERGIILPSNGTGFQPPSKSGVLGLWFFHLINFLAREVVRRDPFPWTQYQWHERESWTRLADPIFDAPSSQRATTSDRLKAKNRRNRQIDH